LKAGNQRWRQEVELEEEDKLLTRRVRNLENRINSLEVELEELRSKIELSEVQKAEEKAGKNIELKDQTIISNKDNSAIQSNNKDNSAI